MYKFVREFKKPGSKSPATTSRSSQVLQESATTAQQETKNGATDSATRAVSIGAVSTQERRTSNGGHDYIPVVDSTAQISSGNVETTSSRKSLSANDVANRRPFLLIKSNHSFNQKNGNFVQFNGI